MLRSSMRLPLATAFLRRVLLFGIPILGALALMLWLSRAAMQRFVFARVELFRISGFREFFNPNSELGIVGTSGFRKFRASGFGAREVRLGRWTTD